jgi:hypothetical protein
MVADPRVATRRVADFMGVALTDEEFARVFERSSFAHMKTITHKYDFIKTFPWSKPEGANVRRGKRGGADELLSPELQKRIDDYFRAELKRLGCDFPYDQAFGTRAPA